MERRKFLIGAGSLAAGSAAAMGTGAFTSVRADRTLSVQVADDSDALLAFDTSGAENAEYVQTDNGTVNVQLTDSDNYSKDGDGSNNADGVNKSALTRIFDLFKVQNQGTQNVFVYVDPETGMPNGLDSGDLYVDPQASGRPDDTDDSYGVGLPANNVSQIRDEISLTGRYTPAFPETNLVGYDKGSFVLEPGQQFNFGLYIRTGESPVSSVSGNMTINAVADYDDFGSE